MINAFDLDKVNILVGNGTFNGLVYFTYQNIDNKFICHIDGNTICDESTIHTLDADFEVVFNNNKMRLVGHDGDEPLDLTIVPITSLKKFQLQINGRYGEFEISKLINLEMKNINISGTLIVDDIDYNFDLVFGSLLMKDKFIISGIDKLTGRAFSITLSMKFGFKPRYQINMSYGKKVLPSTHISSNAKVLTGLFKNIKSIIMS